ncbi:hypothetical protein B0H19DRAFT_1084966 [Mycena capillaripes]|nr:hypothetical protein B0H19DRAFT_1084966 [Mycena capillaripes]
MLQTVIYVALGLSRRVACNTTDGNGKGLRQRGRRKWVDNILNRDKGIEAHLNTNEAGVVIRIGGIRQFADHGHMQKLDESGSKVLERTRSDSFVIAEAWSVKSDVSKYVVTGNQTVDTQWGRASPDQKLRAIGNAPLSIVNQWH